VEETLLIIPLSYHRQNQEAPEFIPCGDHPMTLLALSRCQLCPFEEGWYTSDQSSIIAEAYNVREHGDCGQGSNSLFG